MVGFSVGFAIEARNGVGLAGVGLGLRLILLGFRWWWFFGGWVFCWVCRARSLSVGHRNSILQRKGHRLCWPVPAVCVLGLVAEILICLFGCCEKLIWVRVCCFWWEIIIKK